jgi:hypothetical protein
MITFWTVVSVMVVVVVGCWVLADTVDLVFSVLFRDLPHALLDGARGVTRTMKLLTGVPNRSLLRKYVRPERARSSHFLLSIAVWLLPPSERARYIEEFRAELLDLVGNMRLRHALSVLRGVFVLRLRRGLKKETADAAAKRAKD